MPVGTLAPDWTLKDLSAEPHRLSDYRGKVVVMDFWAVWCISCHREMPARQRLHHDLSRRGLAVLGTSTDEHGGDPVQLIKNRCTRTSCCLTAKQSQRLLVWWGCRRSMSSALMGASSILASARMKSLNSADGLIEGYLTERVK